MEQRKHVSTSFSSMKYESTVSSQTHFKAGLHYGLAVTLKRLFQSSDEDNSRKKEGLQHLRKIHRFSCSRNWDGLDIGIVTLWLCLTGPLLNTADVFALVYPQAPSITSTAISSHWQWLSTNKARRSIFSSTSPLWLFHSSLAITLDSIRLFWLKQPTPIHPSGLFFHCVLNFIFAPQAAYILLWVLL